MNVPNIYDLIFIPKNAGTTFTSQNGIIGINLKDMRYNISFFLKPFSSFFMKGLVFFLKNWLAIVFAAINTTMDPDVAEKIIIKNAYQPKIIPPKIVKLEATGKEKETTKIYKIE